MRLLNRFALVYAVLLVAIATSALWAAPDPNYIQEPNLDIWARVIGELTALGAYSVMLFGALNVVFKLRAYNRLVGDGIRIKEGETVTRGDKTYTGPCHVPSRWIPLGNPKPWISLLIGILVAQWRQWNTFASIDGVTVDHCFMQAERFVNLGLWWPGFFKFGWYVEVALTGLFIGAGPAAVMATGRQAKAVAEFFTNLKITKAKE